jgi:uncharacterized RDD family membrane protein YckC
MGITVLKNNVPWGPFTREQIREGLDRNDFTLQELAYAPGLKEWLPLGEVLDYVDQAAKLPPLPTAKDSLPPSLVAAPAKAAVLSPPALPQLPERAPALPPPPVAPQPVPLLKAAPFVLRFLAFVFDCAVLFGPVSILFIFGFFILETHAWFDHTDKESLRQERLVLWQNFEHLLGLIAIGFAWLYSAGLESSPWQGTVGKQWMGIRVTDMQGERIGFLRATGRHAAKYLSALPCFLGFMMALFSARRLAWHDRLSGTRVVRR